MTAIPPDSYMRIVSFSIVAFDMLQTLPGEYRFYRHQWKKRRISLLCVFFIINRYGGAAALATNAMGYFGGNFTQGSCNRFYLIPVILKTFAGWAATGIIFLRTLAISRHSRITFTLLTLLVIAIIPVQIFSTFNKQYSLVGTGESQGNCISTRLSTDHGYDWTPVYYLTTVIWDMIAFCISTYHLLDHSRGLEFMATFTRQILTHGVLYYLGASLVNLLVYLSLLGILSIKGLDATVNIAVTMILVQHLALATYDFNVSIPTTDRSNTFSDVNHSSQSQSRPRSRSQDVFRYSQKAGGLSSILVNGGSTTDIHSFSPDWGVHGIDSHPNTANIDQMELGAVKVPTVKITDVQDDGIDRERVKEDTSRFRRSYDADAKRLRLPSSRWI